MTEQKILNAVKSGDNKLIFNLLYTNYLPMVRHIVKSYNGTDDDARDVFQDLLIILIREVEAGRIDETKNLKNFIFTIAKNTYLNTLKKANRSESLDTKYDTVYEDKTVKNHIEIKQSEQLILEILKQLGDTCYKILKAIVFENKKHEEIAEDLGLSDRHVVKTYKNRCKMKFIELLRKNPKLCVELIRNEDGFARYITAI